MGEHLRDRHLLAMQVVDEARRLLASYPPTDRFIEATLPLDLALNQLESFEERADG